MRIKKVYKYKLRPTATQRRIFSRWLGTCRFVYNLSLEHRICHWQSAGVAVSEVDQNKELTRAKKAPGFEWISEVHSQVLQDVVRRVRLSFDHFFRGGGFPLCELWPPGACRCECCKEYTRPGTGLRQSI